MPYYRNGRRVKKVKKWRPTIGFLSREIGNKEAYQKNVTICIPKTKVVKYWIYKCTMWFWAVVWTMYFRYPLVFSIKEKPVWVAMFIATLTLI